MKNAFTRLVVTAILLLSCVATAQSPDPSLVAHWPMDEGSGTVVNDVSGRNHHGTIQGDVSEWDWVEGIDETALHFHGGFNYPYVFIPNHSDFVFSTGSFTLEAWARLDGWVNMGYGEIIMGTNYNQTHGITLGFGIDPTNYHRPTFGAMTGLENKAIAQEEAEVDTWYHLVGIRDAELDKIQIYVNGELADEKTDISASLSSEDWSISGQHTWLVHNPVMACFHGVIDEVSIYDRALSPEEVLQHYMKYTDQPPIANAGPDQTVECTSCCATEVTLDGTGSSDPDEDPLTYAWTWDDGSAEGSTPTISLPLGTTTIVLVVNDGQMDSEPNSVDITIQDTTSPEIEVSVDPDLLWPPNHRMVGITVTVTVSDICDENASFVLSSITSSEPDDAAGQGEEDIQEADFGNPDTEFLLRAERDGYGTGRFYAIVYSANDASGNSATSSDTVWVPHDRRRRKKTLPSTRMDIIPDSYRLFQNHPNPFNPATTIRYALSEPAKTTLAIYNITGDKIVTLVDQKQPAGNYRIEWDGKDASGSPVASGVYFYRIQAGKFSKTCKMLFVR